MSLLSEFQNPPDAFRGTDFWMLNDALNDPEIAFQMREMKRQGIASFIARTYIGLRSDYPGPGFKNSLRTIVAEARKNGLKIFLQAGYMPEAVLNLPDEFALRNLFYCPATTAIETGEILARDDAGSSFVAVNSKTFLDMLNPEAICFYLRQSYEDMWAEFQDDFGETIVSIWVDEPSYGRGELPWSKVIPAAFSKKWGYDLQEYLPALFCQKDNSAQVRYHYWTLLQELLKNSYFIQVQDWCHTHNLLFSGHLMTEDTMQAQLRRAGAAMPYYKFFDIPGIDCLCADMNWQHAPLPRRYQQPVFRPVMYTTPLQCSSAAHQAGKSQILCEMYGVSSENLTFRDQKNMFDHFAALGINHKSVHGIFYSLRGRRKRAFPPHINYYQPYWPNYRKLTDYCARVSWFISQGQPVKEILLIHPLASACTEYCGPQASTEEHRALQARDDAFLHLERQLLAQQCEFELADEDTLADWGKIIPSEDTPLLQVGAMSYSTLILPNLRLIAKTTLKILQDFLQAGGKVIVLEKFPDLLDGWLAPDLARQLPGAVLCPELPDLLNTLQKLPHSYSLTCENDVTTILCNHRRDERYEYFFLFNSDCGKICRCRLQVPFTANGLLLSAQDGEKKPADCQPGKDETNFFLTIPEGGSLLFLLDRQTKPQRLNQRCLPFTVLPLMADWQVKRQQDNVLLLEFASWRTKKPDFSPPCPILAIQDILTKQEYHGPLILRYTFQSDFQPHNLNLVLEEPQEQEVYLNGEKITSQPDGYFLPQAFTRIPLPDIVSPGINTLEIQRDFRPLKKATSPITSLFENQPGVELENIYLVGNFAIRSTREATPTHCVRLNQIFCLSQETGRAQTELTTNGYPFYAGTITLQQEITIPADLAGRPAKLCLQGLKACLAEVYLNDQYCGFIAWEPSTLALPNPQPGKNTLRLELTNTLRNLLGPHHRPKGEYGQCWAGYGLPNLCWLGAIDEDTRQPIPDWHLHRSPDTSAWTESYMLTSFGLEEAEIHFAAAKSPDSIG